LVVFLSLDLSVLVKEVLLLFNFAEEHLVTIFVILSLNQGSVVECFFTGLTLGI
jgi:hypothetical protein